MMKKLFLIALLPFALMAGMCSTPENPMIYGSQDVKGGKISVSPQTGQFEALLGYAGQSLAIIPTEKKNHNDQSGTGVIVGIRESGCTGDTPDEKVCESYNQDVLTALGFFGGDTDASKNGISEQIGRAFCTGLACDGLVKVLPQLVSPFDDAEDPDE